MSARLVLLVWASDQRRNVTRSLLLAFACLFNAIVLVVRPPARIPPNFVDIFMLGLSRTIKEMSEAFLYLSGKESLLPSQTTLVD